MLRIMLGSSVEQKEEALNGTGTSLVPALIDAEKMLANVEKIYKRELMV